ncbi:MAG: hypothetical protein WC877_01855 [Dehalococcoidales bacterium]|jgi:hypothetical protein
MATIEDYNKEYTLWETMKPYSRYNGPVIDTTENPCEYCTYSGIHEDSGCPGCFFN